MTGTKEVLRTPIRLKTNVTLQKNGKIVNITKDLLNFNETGVLNTTQNVQIKK
jgi:hypothetical protein